jgi:hypothetical protein
VGNLLLLAAGLATGIVLTVAGILLWTDWAVRREQRQHRRAARAGRLASIPLTDTMLLSLLRLPAGLRIVAMFDHRSQARLLLIVEHPALPPVAAGALVPEVPVIVPEDNSTPRVPAPSEN